MSGVRQFLIVYAKEINTKVDFKKLSITVSLCYGFSSFVLRHNVNCVIDGNESNGFRRELTDHRVIERSLQLKSENLTLSVENEKLRSGLGFGDIASTARIQALEKKLLDKQEELTDMHKRKGDNQQMIIDLNVKVTDLQKQLDGKNNR